MVQATREQMGWRYFIQTPVGLLEAALPDLIRRPTERDTAALRREFHTYTREAKSLLKMSLLFKVLLSFSLISGAVSTYAGFILDVGPARDLMSSVAALAGALTVVLVVIVYALGRYLSLLQTTLTILAMELANTED